MVLRAPNVRKHLSADALFGVLRTDFASIIDHRPGDPDISLPDALMSAFAMFSLKSPSLLDFDQERTEGNVHRVYGIERVPCDTTMREILDPVDPESLRPLFTHVFRALQRGKALEDMVFVEGHDLLALDDTGYFSSKQIHCDSCLEKHHRNGTVTYSHQMPPDHLSSQEIRGYLHSLLTKRQLAWSSCNVVAAAIRFFSVETLGWTPVQLHLPPRPAQKQLLSAWLRRRLEKCV